MIPPLLPRAHPNRLRACENGAKILQSPRAPGVHGHIARTQAGYAVRNRECCAMGFDMATDGLQIIDHPGGGLRVREDHGFDRFGAIGFQGFAEVIRI